MLLLCFLLENEYSVMLPWFIYLLNHYSFCRCVFVDAGVAPIDIETKRRKEEMKVKEAQSRAVAQHGELALITVDAPQVSTNERVSLRPPMLQVIMNSIR